MAARPTSFARGGVALQENCDVCDGRCSFDVHCTPATARLHRSAAIAPLRHRPYTADDTVITPGRFVAVANELIISVSGLRGIVGETLTPDVAFRYAAAFAATLPAGPVLVTRDGRANGPGLVAPVVAGLSQSGKRRVLDARNRRHTDDRRAGAATPMCGRNSDLGQPQSGGIQRDEVVFGRGPRGAGRLWARRCWSGIRMPGCGMRRVGREVQNRASRI